MTRTWTHRCARNLARAIGLDLNSVSFRQPFSQQLFRHERWERDVSFRFSQRRLQFDMECIADCISRNTVELGHHLRSFATITGARDLTGVETLRETPRKSRPLGRTGSIVRHLKERGFDDIIEKEKKLRIVLGIKEHLGAEPSRCMTLLELGKRKDDIGFKGDGRLIAFLKRYPSVFRVHETAEFGKLPWFQFTPEAEAVFDEELAIRKGMDAEVVIKLRKLLMMSRDKTLALSKIVHLGRDLGLPDDFRKSFVYEYPMYFRVKESKDPLDVEGDKLELVRWSGRLAVTEHESKTQGKKQELGPDSLSMSDLDTTKRLRVSKFDEIDCPSPYQDANHLHRRSLQFEKRAVLLVQELLSLTLEKRVLVDHLTHFRKEFNFSKKLHGMLIRHPEYFYVSRKGSRDTVFLRGAFEKIHISESRKEYGLIDKHPLVIVKEKLAALMEVNQLDSNIKNGQLPFQDNGIPAYDSTIPTPKVPW